MKNYKTIKLVLLIAIIFTQSSVLLAQSNPPERCKCGRTERRAVCPKDVPESVLYRPFFSGCGGKAAIILRDDFIDSFSVVVRDSLNRDRFPLPGSGYGGCSKELASSAAPPRSCSAFKASNEYVANISGIPSRVVCFPESGSSSIFSDVRRMTIKVRNSSTAIRRFCLNGPRNKLN